MTKTALEILTQYTGKFLRVVLLDGRIFQGRFSATGPMIKPTARIPQSQTLIFDKIDDIERYKRDILNYNPKNEYFLPGQIKTIEIIG